AAGLMPIWTLGAVFALDAWRLVQPAATGPALVSTSASSASGSSAGISSNRASLVIFASFASFLTAWFQVGWGFFLVKILISLSTSLHLPFTSSLTLPHSARASSSVSFLFPIARQFFFAPIKSVKPCPFLFNAVSALLTCAVFDIAV